MAKKAGIVSLAVHRNTLARRKRQEAQRELLAGIRCMVTSSDCRAYVVVLFDENGQARTMWDTGRIVPQWAMPDMVSAVLRHDFAENGPPDDFIPPEKRK